MIKLNEGSNFDKGQKLWKRAKAIILGGNSLLSKNPIYFYQINGQHILADPKVARYGI